MDKSSQISGFYKLKIEERLALVKEYAGLTDEEAAAVGSTGALPKDLVDRMIENVVGTMPLPLGIATNFQVNGRDYLVPMAIEEPSVVAAASNLAKVARTKGGFHTSHSGSVMIGQIQLTGVTDPLGGASAFSYDEGGNLVARRDAAGNSVALLRDALSRFSGWADGTKQETRLDLSLQGTPFPPTHLIEGI